MCSALRTYLYVFPIAPHFFFKFFLPKIRFTKSHPCNNPKFHNCSLLIIEDLISIYCAQIKTPNHVSHILVFSQNTHSFTHILMYVGLVVGYGPPSRYNGNKIDLFFFTYRFVFYICNLKKK